VFIDMIISKFMKHFFVLLFNVIIFSGIYAQNDSINYRPVYDAYKIFINDPCLKNASFGICFKDLGSDKIIISDNINKSLIPASTMKLFTSYAALNILGSDFRFKTRLQYDGYLDEAGNLHGNVYITGGGDPTLGSHRFGKKSLTDSLFYQFMNALSSIGIRNIEGSVIGDGSIFSSNMVPYNWQWADVGNYYGSGVNGLNIYENEYSLSFKPADSIGKKAIIDKTDPLIPDLQLINYVNTAPNGGSYDIYILGSPYENNRRVEGSIALNDPIETIRGSIPDPEYYTAYLFYNYLLENKFIMNGKPYGLRQLSEQNITVNQNRTTLYTHVSRPLIDILKLLNAYSINLYAESFLKMMGAVKYKDGSYASGIRVVKEFLAAGKIDQKGFNMFDGSGMSRANTITVKQMSDLLSLIHKSKYFEALVNTLPLSGASGTLSKFGTGTLLEGNLRAKTGTMYNVKAYSGYLKNASKELFSIVVIANNYSCTTGQLQEKIEKLLEKLADSK
jgi:serine-type D-Ala-D-Ala carboxypeptidase/endopeptidase (penicillin-binding protein 4)